MLRPIACAALLVSALVPAEQPAVQAKNWQPVLHGDFCIDYDSEKIDGDWISWSYNKCAKSRVAAMVKANCRDWSDKSAATHTWYEYDKKAGVWRGESFDPTSWQDDLVMVECMSWLMGGRTKK